MKAFDIGIHERPFWQVDLVLNFGSWEGASYVKGQEERIFEWNKKVLKWETSWQVFGIEKKVSIIKYVIFVWSEVCRNILTRVPWAMDALNKRVERYQRLGIWDYLPRNIVIIQNHELSFLSCSWSFQIWLTFFSNALFSNYITNLWE